MSKVLPRKCLQRERLERRYSTLFHNPESQPPMTKKSPSDLVSLRLAALRLRVGRATLTRIVEQRGIAPDGDHNGHPTYSLRNRRKPLKAQTPAQMPECE